MSADASRTEAVTDHWGYRMDTLIQRPSIFEMNKRQCDPPLYRCGQHMTDEAKGYDEGEHSRPVEMLANTGFQQARAEE